MARKAYGNVKLYAGLQAGIEGNLHTMHEVRAGLGGWTFDTGTDDNPIPECFQSHIDGQVNPLAEGVTWSGLDPLIPDDVDPCMS